jgi:hypothetical protein
MQEPTLKIEDWGALRVFFGLRWVCVKSRAIECYT